MNHELLKTVIFDQHAVIQAARIIHRNLYEFDPAANYVVVGVRRAGKSTLLYEQVRKLIADGVDWSRIIYINFEDERISDFCSGDFNDIVSVQCELSAEGRAEGRTEGSAAMSTAMSSEKGYFFFDEIQNVDGWEKFARRLADSGERVYITGSNAHMLSSEIASTLGGRYLEKYVRPYSFEEYLTARGIAHSAPDLTATKSRGYIAGMFHDYLQFGGLPETIRYTAKREYLSSVFQKILLGDIITRKKLRNDYAMRLLIRKIAETLMNEISFSGLHGALKSTGVSISKDAVIDYVGYAKEAYLLFDIKNWFSRFSEREGTPKYYFSDNGLLNLFLVNKTNALLENATAIWLTQQYPEGVFYLRSARTGIDIDFFVPDAGIAIQVCYSLTDQAYDRETGNLFRLAETMPELKKLLIITDNEQRRITQGNRNIEVVPLDLLMLRGI